MKSQVIERMNINLTVKEVENVNWLYEYFKCVKYNKSDCVREAINQFTYILKHNAGETEQEVRKIESQLERAVRAKQQ